MKNTDSTERETHEETGIPECQLTDAVLTISKRIFDKHGIEKGCRIIAEVSKVVEVFKEWPQDIAEDCLLVFIESVQDITSVIKQGSEVHDPKDSMDSEPKERNPEVLKAQEMNQFNP